ncbi:Phage tail protein I [Laribacter hongkongensis HLHK9]|uniref:Phage tail protein I n=1 Tax=Laribacter hongkongensis (strain HLHK9) TaxID=557598 RepID=C1D829_LARHH|nr:phage tail protein I [Laribacter hongkongensis]ACO74619.1 Phage tail protein I [Laribacter hongkongensis HLHK9]
MTASPPDLSDVLAADPRFVELAKLVEKELASVPASSVLVRLIDFAPPELLPVLAEEFSMLDDGWELAETEAARRALLKQSVNIHARKGTPAAIRDVFRAVGLGEIRIDEGRCGKRRDGTYRRDGFAMRGTHLDHWAHYRVVCARLLSVRQAAAVRRMLESVAPASRELVAIDFSDAALIRNGFAHRDGTYTRGLIL